MAPTPKEYDYIVIGGGSGGSGTGRRAAGWYNKKTLMVSEGISGGCCVNVGCVPKKMTANFSSIQEAIEAGRHYGYDLPKDVPFTFETFVDKRHARIQRLNAIYEKNWANDGIELLHAHAKFVGEHELEVTPNDGSAPYRVTAPHICIATGSWPKRTPCKGAEHGITSDEWFSIKHLPKSIAFVGAGYIAVELAGIMNALGVETHMLIRGDTFLRNFDPMVQETLTNHYEESGVIIHKQFCGLEEIKLLNPAKDETDPREKQLKLIFKDGSGELEVNEVLFCVGRDAETRGLDIGKANIKTDKSGHIVVDEYQNTSTSGVYALGDVSGQYELTPVAIAA